MHHTLSQLRERYLLLTLAGMQFSHILDFMIMMPLGPILMREFAIGTHEFGFLVASYSFSAALAGLLAATFVDRFERKRLLLIVFGLFGLATLACALAPSYTTLLVARGLAGAFGGVVGAMVQTLVGDLIPFERRATASGIISTSFSLATVAGVPVSLWLANQFQWRAPFLFIAASTVLFILIAQRFLPDVRHHLTLKKRTHPFAAMFEVLRDRNHLRALLFTLLILFSGFTVIPYITVYAVANIGIAQADIFYIYLFGGAATLLTSRRIGRWADQRGKVKIYRIMALAATLPVLAVTQLTFAPLGLWVGCTTAFFVLVSGRMIPAMAIITSAAQPKLRGTFMSLNSAIQQLASGLAATLAGFITTQNATGQIIGYDRVGYVAIFANLLAMAFVSRIAMHDQQVK
ncbi:MAG: MFS transporter [Gallionellales bacterium CG03_land_8_20_14_0_80_55_15]|nr:MAG: MFS transporter [Gallionellales bacterium CG03_land_8_20_14_0_80_55_15]PIX03495.1 MAG: MFS transporter [Gallionellales bacterium CG_4_8_14_3_um_filter_54_18]PJC05693.1 MAG: MFS transporter [Gallionellales bacterium CG_4_9_14_0_8_um_filter_55_61]